jgi:hypothetical protein
MDTGRHSSRTIKLYRTLNRENGFSFIELSIVMIVSGIVFITLFNAYDLYRKKEELRLVHENIKAAAAQVSLFPEAGGDRYPCPADRSLAPDDANYGREFNPTCDPAAIGLTVGNCTPGGGLCLVAGARDSADADGAPDPVIIGALPVHDLRDINGLSFSDKQSLDPWGSKLLYAVSLNLTQDPFVNTDNKFYNGVIDAKDEHGFTTAGIVNDAHYAILSHGPDRKGGFTLEGQRPVTCGPPPTAVDNENCDDNDATFVQSLGMYQGGTAAFFDDFAYFVTVKSGSLWAYYPNEQHIYNMNTANVGVATDTPDEQLTVNGTLRVNNNALTTEICQSDGSNCFHIEAITETNIIRCTSANQVMLGIQAEPTMGIDELCVTPTIAPLTPTDCGVNRWVRGIRTDGSVICWP